MQGVFIFNRRVWAVLATLSAKRVQSLTQCHWFYGGVTIDSGLITHSLARRRAEIFYSLFMGNYSCLLAGFTIRTQSRIAIAIVYFTSQPSGAPRCELYLWEPTKGKLTVWLLSEWIFKWAMSAITSLVLSVYQLCRVEDIKIKDLYLIG